MFNVSGRLKARIQFEVSYYVKDAGFQTTADVEHSAPASSYFVFQPVDAALESSKVSGIVLSIFVAHRCPYSA